MHKQDNSKFFKYKAGIALIALVAALIAILRGEPILWLPLVLLIVLLGFSYHKKLRLFQRILLYAFTVVAFLRLSKNIFHMAQFEVAHPPEWDFLGFWIYAKAAVQGLNFYEPESVRQLALSLKTSSEFMRELVDTGFWYPPPSMFLFLPLGWFNPNTALLLWYVAHTGILIGCAFLLWRIFARATRWAGLLLTAFLLVAMPSTMSTYEYGQTNFLLLLMVLLFWRDRDRPIGGLWLAIGVLTKPLLAILGLYLLLRWKWKSLVGASVSLVAISLAAIGVFGFSTFSAYFTATHRSDFPDWIYTEPTNQSLLSTIFRLTQYDLSNVTEPIVHPPYIALALILTGATIWFLRCLKDIHDDVALILTLVLSLLIYPSSQMYYALLLVVPFLFLWQNRNQGIRQFSVLWQNHPEGIRQNLAWGNWSIVMLITSAYWIVGYQNGSYVFWVSLFTWLLFAGISLGLIATSPNKLDEQRSHLLIHR